MPGTKTKLKRATRATGLMGGLTALVTGFVGGASALPAAGAGESRESEVRIRTVATGLKNPRGVAVDRWGGVLVAEAGEGRPGCEPGGGTPCVGRTGAVYRVAGGRAGRVVTGLPSAAVTMDDTRQTVVTGPVDVAPGRFGYVVLNGGGTDVEFRAGLGRDAARLGTLHRAPRGRTYADLVAYETRMDPDWVLGHESTEAEPTSVQSNASRLAETGRGGYLVTDSAGNDLLGVSRSGEITTEAVFPGGTAGGERTEAVPGGVVRAPDGTVYVSDMGGLRPGAARIWEIEPGHRPHVLAEGLTAVSDLGLDSSGDLVALSLTTGFGADGVPEPGALHEVDTDTGEAVEIATGDRLMMANGLAVGPDDELYVTNRTVGTDGELVEITR
ncbi:ScyD/ScyE family protein [Streptomyces sp. MAR4 CNX-425]|uniref:ScyD/ScyE family protein n=1 Tax=Streptomyces sp. MAR4 CNX-425 TaxID=3406343 RepID=UPI003B51018F